MEQSSIKYDPASRASGAAAPTPNASHGRSSSIDIGSNATISNVHKRSYSNLFNSPDFFSSTPVRADARLTQSTRECRPQQPANGSKHKAYLSLPMLNGITLDQAWGDEVRSQLDWSGHGLTPRRGLPPLADCHQGEQQKASRGTFGQHTERTGLKISNAPSSVEREGHDEDGSESEDEEEGDVTITSFNFSNEADQLWNQGGLADRTCFVKDEISFLSSGSKSSSQGSSDRQATDDLLDGIMQTLQGRPQSYPPSEFGVHRSDEVIVEEDEDAEREGCSNMNEQQVPSMLAAHENVLTDDDDNQRIHPSIRPRSPGFHLPMRLVRPTSQAFSIATASEASSVFSSPSPSPVPSSRANCALELFRSITMEDSIVKQSIRSHHLTSEFNENRPSSSLSNLLRPGSSASGAIRPETRLAIYTESEPSLPRPISRASKINAQALLALSRNETASSIQIAARPQSSKIIQGKDNQTRGSTTEIHIDQSRPSSRASNRESALLRSKKQHQSDSATCFGNARSSFGGLVRENSRGEKRSVACRQTAFRMSVAVHKSHMVYRTQTSYFSSSSSSFSNIQIGRSSLNPSVESSFIQFHP